MRWVADLNLSYNFFYILCLVPVCLILSSRVFLLSWFLTHILWICFRRGLSESEITFLKEVLLHIFPAFYIATAILWSYVSLLVVEVMISNKIYDFLK